MLARALLSLLLALSCAGASPFYLRGGNGGSGGGPVYQSPNVQVFTASGTWNWSSQFMWVEVYICGAGGGGGGGTAFTSGGSTLGSVGAAGGAGGACIQVGYKGSDLGANQTVTIGTGGGGGSNNTNNCGSPQTIAVCYGAVGGNSTFGSLVTAYAGNGGESGKNVVTDGGGGGCLVGVGVWGDQSGTGNCLDKFGGAGGGPAAGVTGPSPFDSMAGAAGGGAPTATTTVGNGGRSWTGGAGGGAGGNSSWSPSPVTISGGNGGQSASCASAPAGSGTPGVNGANGSSSLSYKAGCGGGGGFANSSGDGTNGGNGGPSAGGGAGGSTFDGTAGNGGSGGNGFAVVTSWYSP